MRIKDMVCLVFFMILPSWAFAQASLAKDLDQLIANVEPDARVGVVIEDLTHKKSVIRIMRMSILPQQVLLRCIQRFGRSVSYVQAFATTHGF